LVEDGGQLPNQNGDYIGEEAEGENAPELGLKSGTALIVERWFSANLVDFS
jgi:hypothetical protein